MALMGHSCTCMRLLSRYCCRLLLQAPCTMDSANASTCMNGFSIQGNFEAARRNYTRLWSQVGRALLSGSIPTEPPSRPFQLHLVGRGDVRTLNMPEFARNHTTVHFNLKFREYYDQVGSHNTPGLPIELVGSKQPCHGQHCAAWPFSQQTCHLFMQCQLILLCLTPLRGCCCCFLCASFSVSHTAAALACPADAAWQHQLPDPEDEQHSGVQPHDRRANHCRQPSAGLIHIPQAPAHLPDGTAGD